jgi:cyclophilin family peptidyl-prolyl cis-trans isomerase
MKSGNSNWFSRTWNRLAGKRSRLNRPSAAARRRAFFLESLEDRRVMAANLDAISQQSVLGGSPLFLALDGSSTTGGELTYTVTSSNPSLVNAFLTSGNRSAKISVQNFGDMTFELFENYAPDVTSHFIALATGNGPGLSGPFYNGVTFHRVINNFVIQGGDPTGTGGGGSPLGEFDDQFNVDLQHNRTGLLSMAKSLDDTNDSQFFITEGPQRHLDFQHSIFGLLTSGENVRDAISNVATNSAGKPNTNVVINSVSIFNDLQHRVLGLKAANGASGEADITVTVSDGSGTDITRVFHVVVTPDGVNNNPFLQPINEPTITSSAGGTFQISGVDAEGDAIYYDAFKTGSVNYTLSVDHNTGIVTVTPPAGFVGTLQVQVGVKNPNTPSTAQGGESQAQMLSRVYDLQTIDVVVAPTSPAAPTAINLLSSSDSGSSNTDNVTNSGTLQFEVTGVNSGDVVRLYANDALVGTATATGTSVTIETNTASSQGQGAYQFTASRLVNNVESPKTAALTVTYDTTAPAAFTTAAPTNAIATQLLTYDAQNPEEGTTGFAYSLSGAPTGLQINSSTGVVTWTPTADQIGTFQFSIIATDAAGNSVNQAVNLNVAAFVNPFIDVQLSIVDANGNALTQLAAGDAFFLVVKAKETGSDPRKIISLYNDITFDASMAEKTGPVDYTFRFSDENGLAVPNAGGFGTPGLFDELGSIDINQLSALAGPAPTQDYEEVYRIPMKALRGGTLTFSADPADNASNLTFAWGKNQGDDELAPNEILFHSVTAQVSASFAPANDTISNVNEDTSNNSLNVLANDLPAGSSDTLTIIAVGNTNHGGTVTISSDKKSLLYTPANNFNGAETFTYTVQNSLGEQAIATVTVNVQPVNDPPQAVNDSLTAAGGQTTSLDVLGNDSTNPDTGETLAITSIGSSGTTGTSANGATLTITNSNTRIAYTPPANFSGTDTFTYTISDGHGGTATATVTVNVSPASHGPVAVADVATVNEDSTSNTLNVLSNDTDVDSDPLTITAVSAGNKGGVISISADKKTLIYTPAANFNGVEEFTYTVTDGSAIATGQVRVTVTNVDDAPVAVNDTATTFLGSTGTLIDVLANDSNVGDPDTLTIASLGSAAHGAVAIDAASGKVRYIPTAGYSGEDSFTYIVSDGHSTSQATVTVTIEPFQPTFVSGRMFLDGNHNLLSDLGEGPLAGVKVTLTGTDINGAAVSKTAISDAFGNYRIEGLLPGAYTLTQADVPLTAPGGALAGSLGGTVQGSNQITFTITGEHAIAGVGAADYDFTETPEQPNLGISTGKSSLFAKRVTSALAVAVAPGGAASWLAPAGTGWDSFTTIQANLSADGTTLNVNAVNGQGTAKQIQIPTSQLRTLGQENGLQVLQLRGDPSLYGIPVTNSNGSNNGGSNNGGSTGGQTNQAPVNSVPGAQSVLAGGVLHFTGANAISIADADAGSQPLRVTLTASNGKLSLSTLAGLAFTTGTGTNDASMTFTGTLSAINAALSGATFTPNSGFTGSATVQITTNDQGAGGALIDIDAIAISVTSSASGEGEGEGESFAAAVDALFSVLA